MFSGRDTTSSAAISVRLLLVSLLFAQERTARGGRAGSPSRVSRAIGTPVSHHPPRAQSIRAADIISVPEKERYLT